MNNSRMNYPLHLGVEGLEGPTIMRMPTDIHFVTFAQFVSHVGGVAHLDDEFVVSRHRHTNTNMVTEINQLFDAT